MVHWNRFFVAVPMALVWTVPSCRHTAPNEAATKSAAPATQASSRLGVSDLSLFVPLKPVKAIRPGDPFKITGDGFQNAPDLATGGARPVLSEALFRTFVDDVYARTGPGGGEGGCTQPTVPDELFNATDVSLLARSRHVALIRGMDRRICDYKLWRVVGFRFDPCLDRPQVKDLHTMSHWPTACRTAEVRLIVQPFSLYEGTWTAIDATIHLIYQLPDTRYLVDELRGLRAVTSQALAAHPLPESEDDDPKTLQPHPGLRSEMATDGGPVSLAFRQLVAQFASEQFLTGMAWMTSSRGSMQWSFGSRKVRDGKLLPHNDPDAESFSSSALAVKQFPFSPMPESVRNIAGAYAPNPPKPESAAFLTLAKNTNDIVNPLEVSQVLQGQNASTCVSCHLSDQTLRQLGEQGGKGDDYAGPSPYQAARSSTVPPVWPPFRRRALTNLHNFSYGPGFAFGVSRRTIHEADDLSETVSRFFPDHVSGGMQRRASSLPPKTRFDTTEPNKG